MNLIDVRNDLEANSLMWVLYRYLTQLGLILKWLYYLRTFV